MTVSIPDSHRDLLDKPIVVTFITVMPDGQPQGSPVWCSFDDPYILINSALGRRKDKNVRANPKVTVVAFDPQNAYHYIEVRGEVTDIIDDRGEAVNHINQLAKTYMGVDQYYGGVAPADLVEERVIYKITPHRVNTM